MAWRRSFGDPPLTPWPPLAQEMTMWGLVEAILGLHFRKGFERL